LSCIVEILSIGNELLLGNTINTNASWLSSQVTSLGGEVTRVTTVRDKLGEISRAIRETLQRGPDFLITTGGIGPTFDDMTLQGMAKALGRRVKLDKEAVRLIREHYARRFHESIEFTKPRLKMGRIPSGSSPLHNPVGTAPGVSLRVGRAQVYCLPGVPSEMKAIFRESISKRIRAKAGGKTFSEKWVKISGIMESTLAPIIDRVMSHWTGVYIKSHPRGVEASGRPHIELHFSTFSSKPMRGAQAIGGALREMKRELRGAGAKVDR
jgi:molybdenum cofactor synthesis domain-containing protein